MSRCRQQLHPLDKETALSMGAHRIICMGEVCRHMDLSSNISQLRVDNHPTAGEKLATSLLNLLSVMRECLS